MLKANNFFNVIQYTLLMTLVNVAQLIIRNNNINCWNEQEEKMLKWCIFATLHFFAVKHLPTFKCFVSTSSSLCQYPKGLDLIFLQTQQNKQSYKLNSYIFYHAHKIEWKTQCASWVHCGMSMLEIACSVLKECFPDWRPFLVCLFVCLFVCFTFLSLFLNFTQLFVTVHVHGEVADTAPASYCESQDGWLQANWKAANTKHVFIG